MAEVLPINFPVPTENTIATYDYFDAIAGVGYRKFYPMIYENSTTVSYALVNDNSLVTPTRGKKITATGNYDFDITTNTPLTISGDATFNYFLSIAGGSFSGTGTIYHVTSGGTETQLGTVTFLAGVSGQAMYCVKITCTQKSFAIGEKIRFSIDCTIGATAELSIDPASLASVAENAGGITGRTLPLTSILILPFKVQN